MTNDLSTLVYFGLAGLVGLFLIVLGAGLLPRRGLWFRTSPTREQGLLLTVFPLAFVAIGILGRDLPFAVFMALCLAVFGLQALGPKRWDRGRVWGAGPAPLRLRSWETIDDRTTLTLSLGYRLVVLDRPHNRAFLEALKASGVPGVVAPPAS